MYEILPEAPLRQLAQPFVEFYKLGGTNIQYYAETGTNISCLAFNNTEIQRGSPGEPTLGKQYQRNTHALVFTTGSLSCPPAVTRGLMAHELAHIVKPYQSFPDPDYDETNDIYICERETDLLASFATSVDDLIALFEHGLAQHQTHEFMYAYAADRLKYLHIVKDIQHHHGLYNQPHASIDDLPIPLGFWKDLEQALLERDNSPQASCEAVQNIVAFLDERKHTQQPSHEHTLS
ncbi:MAG: hypothetical protein WAZ18_00105 [Alphaproteobacteria bacterium]